jgi:hypothetical protein
MNRKWLISLVLVLLGVIVLVVILRRPPALPPIIFLPPTSLPMKSGRIPDRWIPAKWTWLQRACLFVLGPPKQVRFDIRFLNIGGSLTSIVTRDFPGQPLSESNGVATCILPATTRQKLELDSEVLAAPRIVTAEDREAGAGMGMASGSYVANVFAEFRKGTTDLSTRAFITLGTQTNFNAAVRAQLHDSEALFILDARQPNKVTNRVGIWIEASEIDATGNRVQRSKSTIH